MDNGTKVPRSERKNQRPHKHQFVGETARIDEPEN